MPTMTFYTKGNGPIQEFRGFNDRQVQEILTAMCDTGKVYIGIPNAENTNTVYLFRKHVTQIEVRP